MSADAGWVFVVDDDASIRKAFARLLRAEGLSVATFSSADAFLAHERDDAPACLVLDVQMPRQSGLDLQRAIGELDRSLPIVFVTGHGDIPMSVRAMKTGAIDFLAKPVDAADLLRAVRQGLAEAARLREARGKLRLLQNRHATLSLREREVLGHVVAGRLNKQIGHSLGVTEKTIKAHRAQVMQKMGVESLAELVRIAHELGIDGPPTDAPNASTS